MGVERDGSAGELYGADDTFNKEEFGLPWRGSRDGFGSSSPQTSSWT